MLDIALFLDWFSTPTNQNFAILCATFLHGYNNKTGSLHPRLNRKAAMLPFQVSNTQQFFYKSTGKFIIFVCLT
ncbi:hypothetical protein C7N43_05115 [Sphingobacteriales bacterium UPWRP_1]|nr:hypothetical protein BVG80_07040 [Sphingobacteriales bacterium TSM_CSM]PSJ78201.1 hypothetical protein C7N43_05115 [Sphingobacteriales bacterium UPWRP_1]